jgi:hypothetical protein
LWPSHKHSLGGGRLTKHVNINPIELLGGGALHASQKKRRDGRQTEILPSPLSFLGHSPGQRAAVEQQCGRALVRAKNTRRQ